MNLSLIFDIETVAIEDAETYLEPVQAPANYKNPEKISDYIAGKQRDQLAKAALDIDLCRVAAIGFTHAVSERPQVALCQDEDAERSALGAFWAYAKEAHEVIGFNCLDFDVPALIRRSQYLRVRPTLSYYDLNRYRMRKVQDLMQALSFAGKTRYRSLDFYCQRFGIAVEDEIRGADIAELHAAGDWGGIKAHCVADVEKTARLAQRVGVL